MTRRINEYKTGREIGMAAVDDRYELICDRDTGAVSADDVLTIDQITELCIAPKTIIYCD